MNTHGVDTTSKSNDVDLPIRDGTSGDLQESSATKPSKKNNDKDLLKAPGPRPVAAVAKEHGGDAGALDSTDGTRAKSSESEDSTGMPKHTPGTDDDGVQKESHGEGTGDLYVKSSGLKADGGDFDAAAPGAGREADRKCRFPSLLISEPPSRALVRFPRSPSLLREEHRLILPAAGLLEQKGVKREPHPAKAEPTAPEKHHHSKVEDKAHIKSHSDSSVHSDKVSDKSADHAVTSDTTSGDKPKEKISLGQKIKAKLHHS